MTYSMANNNDSSRCGTMSKGKPFSLVSLRVQLAALLSALCLAGAAPQGHAAETPLARVTALEQEHARTQRELEFNQVKLKEAEQQLEEARRELALRQAQLSAMADDSSPELLKNEQQRRTVAQLTLRSQQALVERLARKQSELTAANQALDDKIAQMHSRIADDKDVAKQQARQQVAAEARELIRLRAENAALKSSLALERGRLVRAEERVAELAALADLRGQEIAQLEQELTLLTPPQPQTANSAKPALDQSLVVLDGEEPIYQGEDGERIVIRSHSLAENVVMTQIGPSLYQADLQVAPGKAYFDLHRRRYRGVFPEDYSGEYRFFFDLKNADAPRLSVEKRDETSQVVTNNGGEF